MASSSGTFGAGVRHIRRGGGADAALPFAVESGPSVSLQFWLLAAIVVSITSMDVIWLGPAPVWLIFAGLALVVIAFDPSALRALKHIVARLSQPVIYPWLAFVAVTFALDAARWDLDFSRTTLLNLFQLLTLLVVATLAFSVPARRVVWVIAAIAAVQGVLCIGQILQVEAAWRVPEFLASLSSRAPETADSGPDLLDILRVRGTNVFVFKFNVMQGMLAAFLVTMSAAETRALQYFGIGRRSLLLASAIGLIGVLLTFSRSTWLALGIIGLALMVRLTRRGAAIWLAGAAGIVLLISQMVDLSFIPALARILHPEAVSGSNLPRISQIAYAGHVLAQSPIFGMPMRVVGDDLPVHSVLLRVFIDYGILGVVPYIFVPIGFLSVLLKYARSHRPHLAVIGQAGIAMLVVALVDAWTHSSGLLRLDTTQAPLLATALGLLFGMDARERSAGERR